MNVSFEGIGHLIATFAAENGQEGQVCKLSDNGTVAACQAEEVFCGVMQSIRGDYAGVQLHGFAKVSYSGSAPAVGYNKLVADGNGGVKTGNGKEYLVVSVDTEAMYAMIEL